MSSATASDEGSARRRRIRFAVATRIAASFFLLAVSGLVWTSFGLFLVPLQEEFGGGRGDVTAAFSIFALANAASAPFVGHAMRRWDSRHVLAFLSGLFGLALVATSFVQSIHAYWLVFGLLGGIGAQSVSSFAIFAILARRVRRRPASAMSIADAGSGLATLLGLPLIQAVIDVSGWRLAYLLLGLLALVAGIALHLLLLDPVQRAVQRPAALETTLSRRSTPPLPVWLLAASFFCGSAAYHGLMTQQVALLQDEGIAASTAVWFAAAAGGSVFIWRLLSGQLVDIFGPRRVMVLAAAAMVATFFTLGLALTGQGTATLFAYPLFMGIGFGGQQVILAIALRHKVPPLDFAVYLSYCRFASGVGMAAGPYAAGSISDIATTPAVTAFLLAALAVAHCMFYFVSNRARPS